MNVNSIQMLRSQHSNTIQLKWWEVLLQKSNSLQNQRHIKAFQQDFDLPSNKIQTSKYNWINFLPKNLIEQFSKAPNLYFLIIGIFQTFPSISSTQGIPTMYIPLSIITLVTAIKDFYQDYKRSVSDHLQNSQLLTQIFQNSIQTNILAQDIRVGSIIRVNKNQQIPCDGLIIYAQQGFVYVQTKNLDGQTNLKRKILCKQIRKQISFQINSQQNILKPKIPQINLIYQRPNTNMNTFKGILKRQNDVSTLLNQNNIILRGSKLKNTQFVYLLSLYTGHDTKILLCMNNPPAKKSLIQKKLQKLILVIFLSVIFVSILLSILKQKVPHKLNNAIYPEGTRFCISIVSWILNLTNFVPISLIVTLEAVRLLEGAFLQADEKMRNQDFKAMVNCSNVIQDLGTIQLIASDKTGTLTKNKLTMKLITDGSHIYQQKTPIIPIKLLRFLALCHQSYVDNNGDFESISQDEICILNFCRDHKVLLKQRSEQHICLIINNIPQKYEILHVIQFSSEKRRQSIIIKNQEQQYFIITKGSDKELSQISIKNSIKENLIKDIDIFAKRGYRTLILGYKKLQYIYIHKWLVQHQEAKLSGNIQLLDQLQTQIQSNINLLCGTGIEDQLQDEVIPTIKSFLDANIKFMIISGDKPQTVMAIAKNLHIAEPYLAPTNEFKQEYLLKDLVVFSRCTPREKQKIVSNIQLRTLAVGDGANDVSMITKANIGVGIAGKQGKAASQAADFAISEFKYLKRLLFFYGRQSYRKNSQMVKYNFYKNFLYTFPQITFGFLSNFTGVYIYQAYLAQLFNVLFSSLPIIVYCIYDQQDTQKQLLNNQDNKYLQSQQNVYFSNSSIFLCILESLILGFAISYLIFFFGISLYRSPYDLTMIDVSSILMLFIVIYANIKVIIMIKQITIGMIILCGLGISMYFAAYPLIFKFSLEINQQQKELFSHRAGLIILSCLVISTIVSIVIEAINRKLYEVDKKIMEPSFINKNIIINELRQQ